MSWVNRQEREEFLGTKRKSHSSIHAVWSREKIELFAIMNPPDEERSLKGRWRREREITRNSKQPLPILKERSKGERFELAASFFSQASSERGRTRVKWSGGRKNKRRNVAQKWTPGFLAREYFNSTRKIRLVRLSFIFRHPFSPYRCGRVTWFSYRSQFSLHLVCFSSSFHLLLVSIFFDIVK